MFPAYVTRNPVSMYKTLSELGDFQVISCLFQHTRSKVFLWSENVPLTILLVLACMGGTCTPSLLLTGSSAFLMTSSKDALQCLAFS